jgi:hypothetical protein
MPYQCKRCGYSATTKASLIRHLQSKSPCETKDDDSLREELIEQLQRREHKTDTTQCPTCNKVLAKTNLARHKKVCKENTQRNIVHVSTETLHNLQTQIDEMRGELQSHKEQTVSVKMLHDIEAQISNLRSELQTHMHLKAHNLDNESDNRVDDVVLVQQSRDENVVTQIKTRKSKISQAIRIVCWNTYIGEEIGKAQCVCCQTNSITQHNFHCGHIVADANGGQIKIDNLRPICAVCNNSMGTMNMKEFALYHFNVNI